MRIDNYNEDLLPEKITTKDKLVVAVLGLFIIVVFVGNAAHTQELMDKVESTNAKSGSVAKVRGCLRGWTNQNILPSGIRRKE